MNLAHKRVVLTGAASGIGYEVLKLLVAQVARIVVCDVDEARLGAALAALGETHAQIFPFVADLTTHQAQRDLFEYALHTLEAIDIFIANAGFAYYEQIQGADWDRTERIFSLNVFAPLYAVSRMRELYHCDPYKVVITASTVAHVGLAGYASYSATKAALHRFAEAFRFELDDPRKLMLVYPIATRTDFFRVAGSADLPPPFPTQSPQTVALAMVRGLRRDQKSVYPFPFFRLFLLVDGLFPFIRRFVQGREARKFKRWLRQRR